MIPRRRPRHNGGPRSVVAPLLRKSGMTPKQMAALRAETPEFDWEEI